MKRIILSIIAIATISLSSFGQAPEGFKYQAVVRDAGNTILNNQAVGMRLTIQQGSIGGTTVYQETFAPTTNGYGLVNLEIGSGTTTDDFTTIDWSAGPYFIETAVDITGGTSYAVMGTSQLMSVPYALYAKTSGNGEGPVGPQGPAGNDGATGPQGPQGNVGAIGAQGPAGNDGVDGTVGPQGATGAMGAQGPQGPQGNVGAIGAQGPQGPAGNDGVDGTVGPQGATGAMGATGPQGPQGNVGAIGAQGPQGPAGNDGVDGADGAVGPQGATGAMGAQGPQGPQGNVGAIGAQGPQGPAGNDGVDGADGQGGVTTAGTNVSITGSGIVGDPYVVNATDNVDDADSDPNNELQSLSVSSYGDTLYLSQNGWIIIPGISNANYSVQDQLNLGITPCQLYNSGVSISEFYGKTYQGGWIFYFNPVTCTGLIASASFYRCPQWASHFELSTSVGFTDIIIGSGQANTNTILAGQMNNQEENQCFPNDPMEPWLGGTIMDLPAKYCNDYVVGSYSDWYLPSKNEVLQMVSNLSLTGVYWTSSENSASEVHVVDATGLEVIHTKSYSFTVRPVRSF